MLAKALKVVKLVLGSWFLVLGSWFLVVVSSVKSRQSSSGFWVFSWHYWQWRAAKIAIPIQTSVGEFP
ncbi:hypothetical protein AKH04_22660 [Vibrio parahaemolyticus]|nr:hypothetical protein AKH04_22660 [Vibrio parahaemolyticus]